MSLLDTLRASLRPAEPPAPPLMPSAPQPPAEVAAGPSEALLGPCPFTFGPWEAPLGPDGCACGAPGEAQRPVWHQGTLVAWQRRVWQPWVPLEGPTGASEPTGEPVALFQLVTPNGRQCLASLHPQALLEELASRLAA